MPELDFSRRVELEERMDGPCSYQELRTCLRDLAVMNRLTRAHRPTMLWLEGIFCSSSRPGGAWTGHPNSRAMKLVDVGCGYGDMLRRIERWTAKRGVAMELVGVDVNANAVRAAREATPARSSVRFLLGDVRDCAEAQDADLIAASGMTHHLSEAELVRLLAWMEQTARVGWIVTDLHRMPVPYRLFSVLARGPWWHRFIRPDGMASIRRAFREEDWRRMCAAAQIDAGAITIHTHRPARLVVSRRK
ncbi:MAG TPA: methyltransferase domain-containing protein [Acidobacteriaceae bacterium]|nr:methyltransferase domain-containing protein [Acidobacteriaceae bacterium]